MSDRVAISDSPVTLPNKGVDLKFKSSPLLCLLVATFATAADGEGVRTFWGHYSKYSRKFPGCCPEQEQTAS